MLTENLNWEQRGHLEDQYPDSRASCFQLARYVHWHIPDEGGGNSRINYALKNANFHLLEKERGIYV